MNLFFSGFNPQWNDEFQFYLHAPDLAHIRFALYDSDMGIDDFIGQYSIPFSGIRTGAVIAVILLIICP